MCWSARAVSSGKAHHHAEGGHDQRDEIGALRPLLPEDNENEDRQHGRDRGARHGEEDRIEIGDRGARRRQRGREDQDADESVDPADGGFVHGPFVASRLFILQRQKSTIGPNCTDHRTHTDGSISACRDRDHSRRTGDACNPRPHRRPPPEAWRQTAIHPHLRCKIQGVSKSTVVDAYDRLVADGTIASRRGSGFFVAGPMPPLTLAEIGPKLDRAIDPLWVSRQSLEAGDRMLKPGCGWLPASWMPQEALLKAMRSLARRRPQPYLTDYGEPRGLAPLRQWLSRRLAEQGIEAPPDQILLTDSGTQAIDLACRFLIEPGDTVLVDDPCYFNFLAMLRAHRARIVSVPYTPSGPEMESFARVLAEHRPRLYITNSALHNPTGATLSPANAHRLLKLAEAHSLTIIEDGIFIDFEREASQRLAAFDGLDRVIHIGSFSKTLSAALRSGFIAARAEWIDSLIDMKLATSFGSDPFSAELIFAVLSDGVYRKHVEALNRRLARPWARRSTA